MTMTETEYEERFAQMEERCRRLEEAVEAIAQQDAEQASEVSA